MSEVRNQSKIITTTVPIPMNLLKESFTGDVHYIIEASASKLPAARILHYLSNVNVSHELVFCGEEIAKDLLKAYMSTVLMYKSPDLEALALSVVLHHMGVDLTYDKYTKEDLDDFVEVVGEDILNLWRIRLSCLEVWALYIHKTTRHLAMEYPVDTVTYKDGALRVEGINFIHVLSSPLMDAFIPHIREEDKFLNEELFEERIFAARNMFHYCGTEDNPYLLALFDLFTKEEDEDVPSN